MNATFFSRVGAFLVDILIVSFILSIICLALGNNTSTAEKKMQELDDKLMTSEITPEEYLEEYSITFYDYQKENIIESSLSVVLTLLYFVVFQYINKGQTLGKKILNIRVVDKDNDKPISILKGLLRSFIVLSILSGILLILFLHIFGSKNYLNAYIVILLLEGSFTLTSIICVLYKKDKRGLHDIMANTKVIKESR